MSRVFDAEGKSVPVTLLSADLAVVSRIKKADSSDGYDAVVVEVKSDKEGKKSAFYEFRTEGEADIKVGNSVGVEAFAADDIVEIEGTGKGKGFAGTIKRYGFKRGPKTHGSHNIRKPGSIGGGYPQRVVPGKRMAGRMGGQTVTQKGIKVVHVDTKSGLIALRGSIPGPARKIVKISCK